MPTRKKAKKKNSDFLRCTPATLSDVALRVALLLRKVDTGYTVQIRRVKKNYLIDVICPTP